MRYSHNNTFARLLRKPEGDGGDGGGGAGDQTPAPLIGEDLSFSEGWQGRVGEHAEGLTFKSLPETFKSYKEAQSTIGRLNTEKATIAKEFEDFKGTVKPPEIPKDVKDYVAQVKVPDALPEGVIMPEGVLEAAAKFGIEKGYTPQQVSDFVAFQIGQAAAETEASKTAAFSAVESAKAQISSSVGEQNYELTIANAKAANNVLGLDLNTESLIRNPKLVLALSKIHSKVSPGSLKELGIAKGGESAASASQKADDILTNKENPHYAAFHDTTHANHSTAQAEYNRLITECGAESD